MPMGNHPLTRFIRWWTVLAARGVCDELDGAECHRVLHEWLKAGMPKDVRRFIRERANAAPAATTQPVPIQNR